MCFICVSVFASFQVCVDKVFHIYHWQVDVHEEDEMQFSSSLLSVAMFASALQAIITSNC